MVEGCSGEREPGRLLGRVVGDPERQKKQGKGWDTPRETAARQQDELLGAAKH